MKKILTVLFSIVCIVTNIDAQTITANSIAQNLVKQGEEFVVTVNISKCDLSCFAQYCQQLPEGFTAQEINGGSDNANFYFEKNKVLFQWYKLPINRENVVLKFSVKVQDTLKTGKYQIPGYFTYQINNKLGYVETLSDIEITTK